MKPPHLLLTPFLLVPLSMQGVLELLYAGYVRILLEYRYAPNTSGYKGEMRIQVLVLFVGFVILI